MNTTDPITAALAQAQPHELLAAFVESFNDLTAQLEEVTDQREQLEQELTAARQQHDKQTELLRRLEGEHAQLWQKFTPMQKAVANVAALQVENVKLKTQLAQTQQALTTQRGLGDPKKLKEQVKRLQENNATKEARISQLERDNGKYRHDLTAVQRQGIEAHTKIDQLQRQLAHDTGSGLYHNGEHHLIVWPQITKRQRLDGTIFESRSLLYMHQSGRAALLTYNDDDGTKMCSSPKGGLHPSKEALEFAHNWLFKVNSLQGGIVHESDMVPVDFNGYGNDPARDAT